MSGGVVGDGSPTGDSTDDFVRYCCGKPDCPNDCERETPPVASSSGTGHDAAATPFNPDEWEPHVHRSEVTGQPTGKIELRHKDTAAQDRYVLISDEYSWDAVIAPDGGEVPREVAEAMLVDVGHTFGPDFEPEEQRFRETEVTPDSQWDREFTQDNAGPIHGWKVEG